MNKASFRCALVVLACLPGHAWARGDAVAAISRSAVQAAAPAPSLADQIDALLAARFAAANMTPVADRRAALEDLRQFAQVTVEGLIGAAPSSEVRSLMDARLRPILARHQTNIAAALSTLDGRPPIQVRSPASASDFAPVANAP